MTDEEAWPKYPDGGAPADLAKILYQAQVDLAKADVQREPQRAERDWEAETELFKGFHVAIRSTAQTLAAAKQANAELVQKAAAAVMTIYTGILGLVFAVSTNPLPLRGLLPAIFLGAAVALATAYVAYLTSTPDTEVEAADAARPSVRAYTNAFVDWVNARLDTRAALLRAAVLALGAGLVLLPAPFLDVRSSVSATAPALPAWPAYPPSSPSTELTTVLYKAQVAEAAMLREAALTAESAAESAQIPGTRLDVVEVGAWVVALILAGAIAFVASRPA